MENAPATFSTIKMLFQDCWPKRCMKLSFLLFRDQQVLTRKRTLPENLPDDNAFMGLFRLPVSALFGVKYL